MSVLLRKTGRRKKTCKGRSRRRPKTYRGDTEARRRPDRISSCCLALRRSVSSVFINCRPFLQFLTSLLSNGHTSLPPPPQQPPPEGFDLLANPPLRRERMRKLAISMCVFLCLPFMALAQSS